jgi:GNAT superfamily N-acetyltransferase
VRARPLAGSDDIRAIQSLASRAWPAGWHPGGLGWALARGQLGEQVVLFEDDAGRMLGWAAFGQHGEGDVLAQAEPDHGDVARALVAWVVDNVPAPRLILEVNGADPALGRAALAAGFRPMPDHPVLGMFYEVARPSGAFASGYEVRPVGSDEFAERVAVHREAWRPASLPWSDGRAVDPTAESTFDAAAYRAVRSTWLYDIDLDLVAVAPGGSLAGCCIGWFDAATGVAEIEPLGVVPAHRGRGIAAAMCVAVAERVRARGGKQVFINTGPRDEYPAPSLAYLRAGFRVVARGAVYGLDRTR